MMELVVVAVLSLSLSLSLCFFLTLFLVIMFISLVGCSLRLWVLVADVSSVPIYGSWSRRYETVHSPCRVELVLDHSEEQRTTR